jgi:hypothetical protein
MSPSGKLVNFKINMPMTAIPKSTMTVDPKMDASHLEDSPDWKDGLLQDPGV